MAIPITIIQNQHPESSELLDTDDDDDELDDEEVADLEEDEPDVVFFVAGSNFCPQLRQNFASLGLYTPHLHFMIVYS